MICIDPETKAVTYNPEFYVMKHFAHFIRPGARRVVLGGPWTANGVAFENPDGHLVVVIRNPLSQPASVSLKRGRKLAGFSVKRPIDQHVCAVVKNCWRAFDQIS